MLAKSTSIFHYLSHKEDRIQKKLSRAQWIRADRIVMIIMLLIVITGALLFSVS